MVVPVPAAVTDTVMVIGMCTDAHIRAKRADMRAHANALVADAGAGADRADIGTGTDLRKRRAGREHRSCKNG